MYTLVGVPWQTTNESGIGTDVGLIVVIAGLPLLLEENCFVFTTDAITAPFVERLSLIVFRVNEEAD